MPHADSEPFVAQLAELCRDHPTRAKWVIVPSHGVGLTAGDRLARAGTSWMHLHFVTPADLAIRMAGPFLVEAGVDPNDDTLGPALMLRLLGEVGREVPYYREVEHHPSMADAWWRTLQELRLAGLDASSVRAEAFGAAEKFAAVQAVVARYEAWLRDEQRADLATVYGAALAHPTYCPIGAGDLRLEFPHTIWPPLVRRFLDHLPGTVVAARSLEVPGIALSARSQALCAPVEAVAADPGRARGAGRLVWMRALDRLPATGVSDEASIQMFRAGGQLAEVDALVRRILQSGHRFDAIEVACAHEEQAQLVWEKALRHGWPVTLATGVAVAVTQPGRALVAYCRWLDDDLSARVVIDALHDGAWRPSSLAEADALDGGAAQVTASQAARLLKRASATWGRATYHRSLTRLMAQYEARAADPDEDPAAREQALGQAARASRVRAWMDTVIADVPIAADGAVSLGEVVSAARRLVAATASRTSALDRMAAAALDGALAELRGLGDRRASISTAVRFLEEQVERVRVGRDRPRPGHLHVGLLRDAGIDGRPLVFVMGLEEGQVLPAAIEDSILLDAERAVLSPQLATSRSRLDDAVCTMTRRLAELGHRAGDTRPDGAGAPTPALHLSYSCRDVRQFRDTYPTSLLLQAFRAVRGDARASVRDLDTAMGPAVTPVPSDRARAGSDAEWWLRDGVAAGGSSVSDVEAHFPWTRRGREVTALRAADRLGPADGFVDIARDRLDPSAIDLVVSSSTLEQAAACPFRFFLRYGLGVVAPDEHEREPSLWLDPLTRGSVLHEVFATLMREVRDAHGGTFEAATQRARLRTLGDERLADLRVEMPPPSETVFLREREDFRYDLDLFVAQQAERRSEGVGFEVAFGMLSDAGRDQQLGRADPIVIDLGGTRRLRVRGSIDRIDRVGDNTYEVIDYKTGGYFERGLRGTFAGSTRLQHAVYALAAEDILGASRPGARVAQSTYWFPSAKGRQQQKIISDNTRARTVGVLRDVCDTLAAGVFVQADEEGTCRFCDYKALCEKSPWERVTRKLGDPGNTERSHILGMRRHV